MNVSASGVQTEELLLADTSQVCRRQPRDHVVSLIVRQSKRNTTNKTMFYLIQLCTSTTKACNEPVSYGKILFKNLARYLALRCCLLCLKYILS